MDTALADNLDLTGNSLDAGLPILIFSTTYISLLKTEENLDLDNKSWVKDIFAIALGPLI